MATIRDIAKAAGVSRGTVSNVLNKRGCVSHEKILLVEKAALSMGYVIDKNAGSLRKGVIQALALILPNISETRYSELYRGVLHSAGALGYSVRLFLTDDLPYKEAASINEALTERLGAILTVSCLADPIADYRAPLAGDVPVLFLERPAPKELVSYAFDMQEVAQIVDAQCGARGRLLVLTGDASFPDQKRLRQALLRKKTAAKEDFYENLHGEQSLSAYQMMRDVPDADCILATSDTLASHLRMIYYAGTKRRPRIISLTPLTPSADLYPDAVLLNYQKLGADAAADIIAHLAQGTPLSSRTCPVSGFSNALSFAHHAAARKGTRLKMLMHMTPAVRALQMLSAEFTAQTGIEVDIQTLPLNRVFDEILSGRNRYDVIRIDPSSLSYLAPRIFVPLDTIDPGVSELYRQFLPALTSDDVFSARSHYALPFDVSVQMLFYRRALFESIAEQRAYYEETGQKLQVPADYDSLTSVARFFSRAYRPDAPTAYGASVAMNVPTSAANEYLPRLLFENGLIYNADGRLNLLTDAARRALDGYLEYASYAHVTKQPGWSGIAAALVRGEHALSVLYTNHASHVVRVRGGRTDSEIGFAPLPGRHALLAGGLLGISVRSREKDAAYAFIRWATGAGIAPRLAMLGATSACSCVYTQESILHTYPWLRELPALLAQGTRRPALAFGSARFNQRDFEYRLGENIIAACRRDISSEAALQRTQAYLDSIA